MFHSGFMVPPLHMSPSAQSAHDAYATSCMPLPSAMPPTSPHYPNFSAPQSRVWTTKNPSDPNPSSSTKKGKGKKGVACRGASFTHDEELLLCAAYLNVSRDPIVGTNQTSEMYWQRITNYYNQNRKHWPERTSDSLNTKFRTIASETSFLLAARVLLIVNIKAATVKRTDQSCM
ncbi:hypothetical protein U9M48_032526 [Paspalum notatum var. saurae]|uniref:No apical meristem-associated C-terminal domain-containing protein n=1 Tax=Paspalum notatum var. saurae TaxID=547442 RepID=A0AAQ3U660_PASNO